MRTGMFHDQIELLLIGIAVGLSVVFLAGWLAYIFYLWKR